MNFQPRLWVGALIVCSTLVACNDADKPAAMAAAVVASSDAEITAGMTEQAVAALLGEASYTQTRSIDALTVTHSEWTDESGTRSVQFHNSKAQYSQFMATGN
jgi:hypothetical protein